MKIGTTASGNANPTVSVRVGTAGNGNANGHGKLLALRVGGNGNADGLGSLKAGTAGNGKAKLAAALLGNGLRKRGREGVAGRQRGRVSQASPGPAAVPRQTARLPVRPPRRRRQAPPATAAPSGSGSPSRSMDRSPGAGDPNFRACANDTQFREVGHHVVTQTELT